MAETKVDKAAKRESKFIAEEFRLQKIQLSSEVAGGGTWHSMNLRGIFTNITITENLLEPVLKIRVTIVDAQGFMESFPVIGDEVIEISFSNEDSITTTDDIIKSRFRVYDIQTNPSDRGFGEYTLYGVSEEYILSMQKRVSRRYTGLNSDSVKNIVRTYLGYGKKIVHFRQNVTQSMQLNETIPAIYIFELPMVVEL